MLLLGIVVHHLSRKIKPLGDIRRQVEVGIETLVLVVAMLQDTPDVVIAQRCIVGGVFASTVYSQVVLLREAGVFINLVPPVCIANVLVFVGVDGGS